MSKIYCVYTIHNNITKQIYVGYSSNYKKRWNAERLQAFNPSDVEYHYPLSCSIRKYGLTNFTFQTIESFPSKKEALEAEIFWIAFLMTNRNKWGKNLGGFNLTDGGEGANHSEVVKKKMSDIAKNRYAKGKECHPRFGAVLSDASKNKMSQAAKGRKHSVETKEKMSKSRLENCYRLGTENKWGNHSSESKLKISLSKQKLNAEQQMEVQRLYSLGWTHLEISKQFGCNRKTIGNILQRLRQSI